MRKLQTLSTMIRNSKSSQKIKNFSRKREKDFNSLIEMNSQ